MGNNDQGTKRPLGKGYPLLSWEANSVSAEKQR